LRGTSEQLWQRIALLKVTTLKQGKLIKIGQAKVANGEIHLKIPFRSWKLEPSEISAIRLEKVRSLVDEIGVFLDAGRVFFFTDAIPNLQEIAELLRFNELFGDGWYQRAESGEKLSWKRA
jgi:hypothetical protein